MNPIAITAAVCTYNRAAQVLRCLTSLVTQDCPAFEIVVVDDASSDGTDERISEFRRNLTSADTLRYVRHGTNKGVAAARNTAMEHARGDVVAFTDDDCIVDPDWLRRASECHSRHPEAAVVGGPVRNGFEDNILARIGQEMVTEQLHRRRVDGCYTTFLVGNNTSYKRAIVRELGGFKEVLRRAADEGELQDRLVARGHRLVFCTEMIVTHFQRNTLSSFLRQHYTYGTSMALNRVTGHRPPASGGKGEHATAGFGRVLGLPFRVSRYLDRRWDKVLCFPLVYLGWSARAFGQMLGRLKYALLPARLRHPPT